MANNTPQPSELSNKDTVPASDPAPVPDPVTVPVPEDEGESFILYNDEDGKSHRVKLSTYRAKGLG